MNANLTLMLIVAGLIFYYRGTIAGKVLRSLRKS